MLRAMGMCRLTSARCRGVMGNGTSPHNARRRWSREQCESRWSSSEHGEPDVEGSQRGVRPACSRMAHVGDLPMGSSKAALSVVFRCSEVLKMVGRGLEFCRNLRCVQNDYSTRHTTKPAAVIGGSSVSGLIRTACGWHLAIKCVVRCAIK